MGLALAAQRSTDDTEDDASLVGSYRDMAGPPRIQVCNVRSF